MLDRCVVKQARNRPIQIARDICSGLLDLIYPPHCLVCGRDGDDYLCAECIEKIDTIEAPYCRKCGIPGGPEDFYCLDCRIREYEFEQACSAGTYDGVLRQAIHALKYDLHLVMAAPLADVMARCFYRTYFARRVDLVIPVPIHRSRMVDRGFNQSAELARRFCAGVGLPIEANILVKRRRTKHQVDLPQDQRAVNVEGVFAIRDRAKVAGKRILLVDDVFTTGSTINEAAKTLRAAGASEILAYTLARSL